MTIQTRKSLVLETPAASPEHTHQHFMNKLSVETDVADVHYDMQNGLNDFLLIDVRSAKAYGECHVPGAINLPSNQTATKQPQHFRKSKRSSSTAGGLLAMAAPKGLLVSQVSGSR